MKEYLQKKNGGVFFIPLFLPDSIKDNRKSYKKHIFNPDDKYAYGRLIEENDTNGDLIEVFKYIGSMPDSISTILSSGLLFNPLHVAMGFSKMRWRFIFNTENYNKEKDSGYKDICFVLGDYDTPELWKGGEIIDISEEKANQYEHWIIYSPTQLEDKIREHIN